METAECIVIGAGVIGLAVGRALAQSGREVLLLESEGAIGQHTSSRNTGVIHAGLGYPPGSLKGRLCRTGRDLLYRYCVERGIGHRRVGKLIPIPERATEEDRASLRRLQALAVSNGCEDIRWLERGDIRSFEPELRSEAALFSPSSGIVDQHDLMTALWGDLTLKGGSIAFKTTACGGKASGAWIEIQTAGAEEIRLRCDICVNAAGFNAPDVARGLEGLPSEAIPPRLLQKGSYFVLAGASPFSHLVYPHRHGLHASLDMAGLLRFGPDAEWTDEVDYSFDETRSAQFYRKVREFWPDLPDGALTPGWVGVRPKIARKSANEVDFVIQDAGIHGAPGLVNLFGIESPGLTSCLAIAQDVAIRLGAAPNRLGPLNLKETGIGAPCD